MKVTLYFRSLALISLIVLLGSCSSNHIKFYALKGIDSPAISGINDDIIIGISRVVVPDYMKNQGVTSLLSDGSATTSGRLIISNTHAWAGEVDTQLTQTIAQNMGQQLQHSKVWPSPWPHGVKPKVRVQVVIEQLAGQLRGDVVLKAKWIINDTSTKKKPASGLFSSTVAVQNASKKEAYGAYTHAISQVVSELSQSLSNELVKQL